MRLKRGIITRWWDALLIPFAGLVMVYIIIKSTWAEYETGWHLLAQQLLSLSELRKQV
jgi:hypothetical protein